MDGNQNYFNNINDPQPVQPPQKEKGSGKGLFFVGLVSGIAVALLVVAVGWFGMEIQKAVESNGGGAADMPELDESSALDSNTIAKLQALVDTIDKYFFLHEVTDQEMRDGMYKGLLASLDDPYSEYYTVEELNELMEQSEGIYYGIGAYVQLDEDTGLPKISGVIEGSPAEEANLRANDLVYEVDGASTYGLNLTEAVGLIKGPEGTEVELTLIREGESDYVKLTLTRRKVESPTVEFSMLEDDMAYIQVTEFDDVTVDQFADALAMAKGSDAKGIILDLRGNPGGNLDAVVDMCNMILPEGMIVYTEDKYGERKEYKSDGTHELDLPLVVLVDMNSASAAEIMAGAIKDYGTGTLVGTTTFGKGIVQQIMSFRDGSAIKITISAYYTPKGNNIHGIGIVPDVVCEFDGEAYYGSPEHPDNQLEKAKDVLREKMGK
ncbi:MAG: S41 family peptidase [Firmicutes bacterium]|nr:S41 family peptidase [Bacillota bacterium]